MTKLLERVIAQASQLPDAEQDAVALALLKALEQLEQHYQPQSKPYRRAGSAEGLFVIPDDFDEPLKDCKEHL